MVLSGRALTNYITCQAKLFFNRYLEYLAQNYLEGISMIDTFRISLYAITFLFMQAYPHGILQQVISKYSTFQGLLRFLWRD